MSLLHPLGAAWGGSGVPASPAESSLGQERCHCFTRHEQPGAGPVSPTLPARSREEPGAGAMSPTSPAGNSLGQERCPRHHLLEAVSIHHWVGAYVPKLQGSGLGTIRGSQSQGAELGGIVELHTGGFHAVRSHIALIEDATTEWSPVLELVSAVCSGAPAQILGTYLISRDDPTGLA